MFGKILIANRGEIACRIMRTARRLAIRTVAVYSDADAQALHAAMADEACRIGPAPAQESYLDVDRILEAAQRTGAEAIHPGYGFLSENADFAEACAKAGIVFIGPPPGAIRAMGSKSEAKAIMAGAGVPLVPGYHGADQADAVLREAAERIGYPVLIKASAGGGGKGMRRVDRAQEFAAALAGARREARAAFGDDRVLVERYLEAPRHIEVQVFADTHGNVVHLFERDCSIQRRHQKVIEEAPAPGLTPERRRAIGAAAVDAARAIGYVNAGTVEFIADRDGAFHFMEMNTRLQVEHPVTEMISGQDLVEWQIRIAAGEALPLRQDQLEPAGHAIEARIYAEDPWRDFLPATGRLAHLRLPCDDRHVRVDAGVRAGDEVTIDYDPMLAKLVVWDRDRAAAVRRLGSALASCQAVGVATNLEFLARVARHPAFAAHEVDTGFIERHRESLLAPPAAPGDRELALVCLDALLRRAAAAEAAAARSADPYSPWRSTSGWRMNLDPYDAMRFRAGDAEIAVTVHYRPGGFDLDLPGGRLAVQGESTASGDLHATLGGQRIAATVVWQSAAATLMVDGATWRVERIDRRILAVQSSSPDGAMTAPMPGRIVQVLIETGGKVGRGQALMVLEAMKMEHTIAAPADGIVREIRYAAGDLVSEGAELLVFEALDRDG